MSQHIPMSVRSELVEKLLVDSTILDILLSDIYHYNAAKQILWRKENQPAIGSTVYTDNCHGDEYDWTVKEQHMDYSITVVHDHYTERLLTWRTTPNASI